MKEDVKLSMDSAVCKTFRVFLHNIARKITVYYTFCSETLI
jgi:hypothetical protein